MKKYDSLNPSDMLDHKLWLAVRIKRLLDKFIKEHGQEFNFSALEKDLKRSANYLNRVFKTVFGYSMRQYKEQGLLLLALQHFIMSYPITQTAYALGYNSPSAFAHFFKRMTGLSASQYINRYLRQRIKIQFHFVSHVYIQLPRNVQC